MLRERRSAMTFLIRSTLFLAFVFLHLNQVTEAFPEIGIHAGLQDKITATKAGWLTLNNWFVDDSLTIDEKFKGSFRNDIVLNSKTSVSMPITGIYHVSASIPIHNINYTLNTSRFTVAMVSDEKAHSKFVASMVIGSDHEPSHVSLQTSFQTTLGDFTTLVLSGFAEFHAGEKVSFQMHSTTDPSYYVSVGAKFSIHFIGSSQTAPAFLIQIDNDYSLSTPAGEIIKPYRTSGRAKLYSYLAGLNAVEGKYVTACQGVFNLAGNFMVEGGAGVYTLQVLINDQVSATYTTKTVKNALVPLNVFESFKLGKGVVIKMRVNTTASGTVTIKKYSSWSMGYIGSEIDGLEEFSIFLPQQQNLAATSSSNFYYINVDITEATKQLSTGVQGKFISPSDLSFQQNEKFQTNLANFFYVSVDFHIGGEAEDIEVVIPVGLDARESDLPKKGITARTRKLANEIQTISLSGVMIITDGQYLAFLIKSHDGKALTVTTASYISVVQVRYLISSFSVRQHVDFPFAGDQWNMVTGPFRSQDKGVFSFGGDFSTADGKFTSSHTGVHTVHATVNFINLCNTTTEMIEVNFIIDGIESTTNGFYAMEKNPGAIATLRLYGALNLNSGQIVAIRIRHTGCAGSYTLSKNTQFSISYIGTQYITPSLFGTKKADETITSNPYIIAVNTEKTVNRTTHFQTDDQFDGTRYTAFDDGIFIVTANALISNLSCTAKTYFALRVLVTGTGNKVGGGASYNDFPTNIRDMWFGQSGKFTLTVSSSIRLKVGESVTIQLIESLEVIDDGVTNTASNSKCTSYVLLEGSSVSIIRWSGATELSPEGYVNAGFLARTDSDTTIASTDSWKTFQPNAMESIKNLDMAGFYEFGDSIVKVSSKYAIDLIRRAGIYYISGSISLKILQDTESYLYEVNVHLNQNFETGIYASANHDPDSDYLSITFAGTMYLMYGQSTSEIFISVRSSSPNTFYIYGRSTFSIVKLQPDYKTPGIVTEASNELVWNESTLKISSWYAENNKGLTVNNIGFEHETAAYSIQQTGFYFVDINIMLNENSTVLADGYTLELLRDRNGTNGTVIVRVESGAGAHTTIISDLLYFEYQDLIYVQLVSDQYANLNNSQFDGGYTVYFVKAPREFKGFRSYLGTPDSLPSSTGVSGWENSNSVNYYNGAVNQTDVMIAMHSGVYVVSFNPSFTHSSTPGTYTAKIQLNSADTVTGTAASTQRASIPLSQTLLLSKGDKLTFIVTGEAGSSVTNTSSRSLVYMGASSVLAGGLSVIKAAKTTYTGYSGIVDGLGTTQNGFYLENNTTLVNGNALAILKPGFFRITAHVTVKNTGVKRNFRLETLITDIDRNLNNLKSVLEIDSNESGTLIVSSVVSLRKFDTIQFKVFVPTVGSFEIAAGSTASLVVLDDNTGPTQCEDVRISLENIPSFTRLQTKENITYDCTPIANKVPEEYKWYRNGVVTGVTTSKYVISSLKLSDSAMYYCTAKFFDVLAQSNNATLEVYNPYPFANATEGKGYSYTVTENEPVEVLVTFSVEAFMFKPKDVVSNISLQIMSGDPVNDFVFGKPSNTTITLSTNRPLDYEKYKFYTLKVRATNLEEPTASGKPGPYLYDFEVNVTVININDNAPVFGQDFYSTDIPENYAVSGVVATITATDLDNDALTYSLVSNMSSPYFAINKNTGVVTVISALDRESIVNHTLFIVAFDGIHTGVTELFIVVTDVNDNDPTFTDSSFTISISEAAYVPHVILKVIATDPDLGNNSTLTYTILSGNVRNKFSLDANTGNLSLVNALDYENTTSYVLNISVTDQGTPATRTSPRTLLVTILVVDNNDNNPMFEKSLYQQTVSESLPVSSVVETVRAIDADGTSLYNTVQYKIMDTLADQYFTIHSNGSITLKKTLVYHQYQEYRFAVQAYDGAVKISRHMTTTVVVKVTDVNDNAPIIHIPVYNITISEGTSVGTSIGWTNASDIDTVGTYTYSASGADSSKVLYGSSNGEIVLKTHLDYENPADRLLTFTVTVSDGVASATGTVNIIVTDVNDNEPRFTMKYYVGSISEDALAGYSVVRVNATDRDALNSKESTIRYHIETDASNTSPTLFTIDDVTGIITLKNNNTLDYETQMKHQFKVYATDMGDIYTLSGYTTVLIYVTDVDDTAPDMHTGVQRIQVKESHLLDQPLVAFKASDNDTAKTLTYEIISGNGGSTFKIVGWYLELAKKLDFETTKSYTLSVVAKDAKNRPSSAAVVEVTVVKVNEFHPVFSTSYLKFEVFENSGLNVIVDLNATDDDHPLSTLKYSLMNSTDFEINSATGVISNVVELDYERQKLYSLVAAVSDQDSPYMQSFTLVDVIVKDRNDKAPYFLPTSIDIKISEKAPNGMTIATLKAYDEDTAVGSLTFGAATMDAHFALDTATGVVTLKTEIDIDDSLVTGSYIMKFYVTDGVNMSPANATVRVSVVDRNDNEPIFVKNEYVVYIDENTNSNTLIETVLALDSDLTAIENSLVYTIVADDVSGNFTFGTSPNELKLYTTQVFDYEKVKEYVFMIQANNTKSEDQLTGRAIVRVHVNDVNDNTPVPAQTVYVLNVTEATTVGTPIVTVLATDADSTTNGQLTYTLSNTSNFNIHPNTGEITLTTKLDRLVQEKFDLTVKVSDRGIPPLSANVQVIINVIEVSTSIVLSDMETVEIYENVLVGTSVITLNATSRSGQVTYTMINNVDSTSFSLNSTTGEIKTGATFDYETKRFYLFQIKADDPFLNSSGRIQVFVRILDYNDITPTINSLKLVYNISEATRMNSVVASLSYEDGDSGNNGEVEFKLLGGDGVGTFLVDKQGYVTLNASLDYRVKNMYTLLIQGEDNGTPPLHSNVTIIVHVFKANVDFNVLVFSQSYYRICINENTNQNSFLTVNAVNKNPIGSTVVTYTFAANTVADILGKFAINSASGAISTKQPLDYEEMKTYEIVVVATNNENYRDTAVVEICVNDINDNKVTFKEQNAQVSLSEIVPVNTLIFRLVVLDNDTMLHSLSMNSSNAIIRITSTGYVYLNQPLNYENTKSHTSTINVYESGIFQDSMTFKIDVSDFNDNRPVFVKSLVTYTVREDAATGSLVGTVDATDADITTANNQITYSLISSTALFKVLSNGSVYVDGSLDLTPLTDKQHELVVKATDNGWMGLIGIINVVITVTDTNNNRPVFAKNAYTNKISEDAPVGSEVACVVANDGDFDIGQTVSYVLNDASGHFTINANTGIVSVNSVLDYELKRTYPMTVQAVDDGGLTSTINASVVITIFDVNDNLPAFVQDRYYLNLTEDTATNTNLLTFTATDGDFSGNTLTYAIATNEEADYFKITTDKLQLRQSLDHETQKVHIFMVRATDSATKKLHGRCLVIVTVIDVNDNNPVWKSIVPFNVTISEAHIVNSYVTEMVATDADETAILTYAIVSGHDNKFSVASNGNRGTVTLTAAVDYDVKNLYTMPVRVSDGVAILTTTLYVYITPVDKLEPSFNQTVYEVSVYENIAAASHILTVSYTTETAPFASININEQVGSNNFAISNDGKIRTRVLYDYEAKSQYVFTLTVTDTRGLTGRATVIVNILNINDKCPVVLPSTQTVQITEPTVDNTVVAVVRAYDQDSDTLTFSLVNTTNNVLNNKFKIDQYGGVRADGNIDINNRTESRLTVSVSDGKCTKTATVIVFVNPVIACPVCRTYQFIQPTYYVTVPENVLRNTLITVMTNRHGNTNYSIVDAAALAHVVIGERSGVIDLTTAFDYEVTKTLAFDVLGVSFIIQNPEESVTMRARVIITVTDVNDNCPSFTNADPLALTYSSPIESGTLIGRVTFTDTDSSVVHSLTTSDAANFAVDSAGNIRTAKKLESLTEQKYTVTVTSTDSACVDTTQINLTMTVCPEPMTYMFTDNANYEETVYENKTVGTAFVIAPTILGSYSVVYSIVETSARVKFFINQNTGMLILQGALDYETERKHTFTVKAQILTIFEAYATVIINVLDVNDVCPTISNVAWKYRGNPDVNQVIGTLSATDSDSQSTFSITSGNNDGYFALNANTGVVTVAKAFSYSYTQTYVLTVRVNDPNNVRNCPLLTRTVTVDVKTCNNPEDYQFTEARYVKTYLENRALGDLFQVAIRTSYMSRTFKIVYPAGAVQRYSINATTGTISLDSSLDYETHKQEFFEVHATFSDGVVSKAVVEINVRDVNDNCPSFSSAVSMVTLTEPLKVGLWVAQPMVVDADTTAVNTHAYSMSGDNHFSIDQSGLVTVQTLYDSTRTVDNMVVNLTITLADFNSCGVITHIVSVNIEKVLLYKYLFAKPLYKFPIAEDQTAPFMIHCFKNLYGNNGTFKLINDATNSSCFSVSTKGDLTLTKQLDYEAYTHHYLEVSVTYPNGLMAYAGVVIIVGNVNDNKPQLFHYPPVITINPSFARHTMIGEVDVVDADRPKPRTNAFVFSVESGDPKSIFGISHTGQVYTKRCMTGTDVGVYNLKIKVNDGNVFHAFETFTVRVFDVADSLFSKSCPVKCSDYGNPENYMFGNGLKMVEVLEDTAVMTNLLSTDVNAFPNATFALSSHAAGYFTIYNNGSIYLNKSLNYESQRVHYFTVIASIPSRVTGTIITSKLAVMVMVKNVEDVKPMVDAPAQISISELALSGTVVGYLKARDADTNMASITYTSNSTYQSAVSVNNKGEIEVHNLAGVPHNTYFPMTWTVNDGKHSATGVIQYRVVDVNNFVPMFTSNLYSFEIDEGKIGVVGTVSASDSDASSNVTYSLDVSSNTKFSIMGNTGIISTRVGLDYESETVHHLTVMATDNGGYVGVTVATVIVKDLNDNLPEFTGGNPLFTATVNENTLVGSFVILMAASDKDTATNLVYLITTPTEYFEIDQTGVVVLKKSLRMSGNNEHTVTVTIGDGVRGISGVLTVNVDRSSTVTCPTLTGFNTRTITVSENTVAGTNILSLPSLVTATQHFSQFAFSMDGTSSHFEVVNGELRLKSALDYETTSSYSITIVAHDTLRNTTTKLPLTVSVGDVDESTPTITVSAITVSETVQVGSIIGLITATDSDGSSNMAFEIENGDGTFAVDSSTGAITVMKPLDASKVSSYTLKTCVTSSGVRQCQNVSFSISNINSNSPSFGVTTMTLSVPKNTADHTVISTVSAADADGDAITYSMNALSDTTVSTIFYVNQTNGHITVKDTSVPGVYRFFLIATDGTLTTCIPVTITVPVDGSGATPPHFTTVNYAVTVFTTSTDIVRVEAVDPPDTPSLRYTILSGNTGNTFVLHKVSGKLSKAKGATLTVGTLYNLKIAATNQRTSLAGTTNVYVAVGSSINGAKPKSFVQEVVGTQLLLNMSLADFDQTKVVAYLIIGQEFPATTDVSAQSLMEPVTYYLAFNTTGAQALVYRYRLYNVAKIPASEIAGKRTRRGLENANADTALVRVGTGATCAPSDTYCDGPLNPGTSYRFTIAAVYDTNGETPELIVFSPASPAALTVGPNTGQVSNISTSIHTNAIVIWVVALVVLGTLFWLAILAIAIILCYKRRYVHDKAYDLGYNGPPVPRGNNAYSFDNKGMNGNGHDTAAIHYSEVSTVAQRNPQQQERHITKVTHAPVVLDSPEHSPQTKPKLQTYEDSNGSYDTHSAKLKFGDENPEWESMDIQLRIDPTGERDPVITRRDTAKAGETESEVRQIDPSSVSNVTTTTTTIRQIVDEKGDVIEEQIVDQKLEKELSRL